MVNLFIEQTKATPLVDFNLEKNILSLKGESYPENAFKFYEPILNWLDEFLEQLKTKDLLIIEIRMSYFNTSSSKCIIMMLDKFEDAIKDGKDIVVNWYYDEENDSELECAEEFKEFVDFEFNLIPQSN